MIMMRIMISVMPVMLMNNNNNCNEGNDNDNKYEKEYYYRRYHQQHYYHPHHYLYHHQANHTIRFDCGWNEEGLLNSRRLLGIKSILFFLFIYPEYSSSGYQIDHINILKYSGAVYRRVRDSYHWGTRLNSGLKLGIRELTSQLVTMHWKYETKGSRPT